MKFRVFLCTACLVLATGNAVGKTVVGGETYKCDNACVVTSINPPVVKDCCGGEVWKRVIPPAPEPDKGT